MAQTLLKVDNINVFYGNIHAVKDVSFEVNEGEIVTLIGANGAGKSTTLKTVSGLLHPKTGDVLYKGKSIKGVRAHKIVEAGLAQVPEGRHVFLHMTVEENLDMGAYTQPNSTIAPNKEKVFELFPRLKERRKQLAGTMSGGEQQMLAMGRALMSNASMLMLDEPSMGLSPLLVHRCRTADQRACPQCISGRLKYRTRGCCICDSLYFCTNRRKNQTVSIPETEACATNFLENQKFSMDL